MKKIKVALNIKGLKPRDQLAKFQKGITKCTGNAVIGATNPTLVVCQASLDAASDKLDEIDTDEQTLSAKRIVRDQLLDAAMGNYGQLGSFVENKCAGNPAVATDAGFDVASGPTPAPDVMRIMNLVLTHGDHDGSVDAAWNRDTSARSYEVQTSPDPLTATSFAPKQTAPQSSCTITGLTSGSKIWVRVRAIGSDNTGEWSDPAVIIVP
jgi:hypothetical protein